MARNEIATSNAPSPGGAYSQALSANGLVFTAGMGPQDPLSGRIVGSTVEEQTRQTLRNIEAVLEAAGLTLDDIIKATVHLQDLDRDFAEFNGVYEQVLNKPYPVRTTVGSTLAGILVEIDVVAAKA